MLEIIVAIIIVALGVVATRLNDRLNRLQREFEALRGFVLSTMTAEGTTSRRSEPARKPASPLARLDEAAREHPAAEAAASGEASRQPQRRSYAWTSEDELEPEPAAPVVEPASAQPAPVPAAEPAASRPDIETALGTRWAVWVGGLALALGGVFLVRYSIEAGIFGPGVRLLMAALFGAALVAAGEFIRRTGFRVPVEGIDAAWMPGILTAVGAFTLFGTVYAAHGLYGFIGPAFAFLLLGLLGIGTILAALIHGQALAGVGLLGAFATPMLVASQAPSAWILFGYLAVVLAAAAAIARLRDWTALMTGAVVGTGLWSLFYLIAMPEIRLAPALFANAVVLAVLSLVWLGGRDGTARFDAPSIASSLFVGLAALFMLVDPDFILAGGGYHAALLITGMAAVAWWRRSALPLLHAAGGALVLAQLRIALSGQFSFQILGEPVTFQGPAVLPWTASGAWMSVLLALLFLGLGVFVARSVVAERPLRAAIWSGWAVLVPLAVLAGGWIAYGDVDMDLPRALAALALAVAFCAAGEVVARSEEPPRTGGLATSLAFAGAAFAAALMLLMAFGPFWTTVLGGAAAVLPAVATRWRGYPVLGWLSVGAALFTLVRVAVDPTIIGAPFLGTFPVFNALLPGYGIPAVAFGFAAWQLARTTDGRPRLAMEAAAVLFALLTVAMLVRHAMSGGIIDGAAVTLAEQSIYTLIMLGAGAILVTLDARAPSPVMRIGSLAAAVLSVVLIAIRHFGTLNPLFTGEPAGPIPVFDLLLLGYLLPAVAAAGLAWFARDRRPRWYCDLLALAAAALAFAWVSLFVRRLFQGENLAYWRGVSQLETYAYSAVWLAVGVGILVLGVRFASQTLRIASGLLVALAVAKVFLFDMAELEGVLRAFSFIGLGAVLIGIGLFYQRLLTGAAAKARAAPEAAPEPEPAPAPVEEAPPVAEPVVRRVVLPAWDPALAEPQAKDAAAAGQAISDPKLPDEREPAPADAPNPAAETVAPAEPTTPTVKPAAPEAALGTPPVEPSEPKEEPAALRAPIGAKEAAPPLADGPPSTQEAAPAGETPPDLPAPSPDQPSAGEPASAEEPAATDVVSVPEKKPPVKKRAPRKPPASGKKAAAPRRSPRKPGKD